ncbi:MAG: hypothetical protein ABI822_29370, partial [Bryobacteraceae bacterium]
HPRESLATGQLHAHVQSNQINLAEIRSLQRERPNTGGLVNLNADMNGNVSTTIVKGKEETEFLPTSVNLDAAARNLQFEGQNYGDLTAKASTVGQTVNYDVTSNFAGSAIKINGATQLAKEYPTTADLNLQHLPVERILALAKRSEIPARGNLSGTAHVTGTMTNPQGNADLDLTKGVLYDEPIDHLRARVSYQPELIDVPLFEVVSGPSQIQLTGQYKHPTGNLNAGDLEFHINSNRVELGRIRSVQKARPGLAGVLQINASGGAVVREATPPCSCAT